MKVSLEDLERLSLKYNKPVCGTMATEGLAMVVLNCTIAVCERLEALNRTGPSGVSSEGAPPDPKPEVCPVCSGTGFSVRCRDCDFEVDREIL